LGYSYYGERPKDDLPPHLNPLPRGPEGTRMLFLEILL